MLWGILITALYNHPRMLYIFTAIFPYGTAEPFLEDEIQYLKKVFSEITIVPLSGSGKARSLPDGVRVLKPVLSTKRNKFFKGLFHHKTLSIFLKDFLSKKVFLNKTRFRQWLAAYFNTNCALKSDSVKKVSKALKTSDVCYFYWGKGLNTLSLFWKGRAKMVSRFHGEWDLWEESAGYYAPIRTEVAKSLDLAVFISEKGKLYFENRYPFCPTFVSRLGSVDCGEGARSSDGKLRIVSCSSVYPLKRVDLIYESITKIRGRKVVWTHIGDGNDFDSLKQVVQDTAPDFLECSFPGWLNHSEVLDFYSKNPVDIFINLSTNEGIPVSIMEAISFGIPVVATNVGGTSEVVTEKTGVLVSANPTAEDVAEAISGVQQKSLRPREFWFQNYNADINYSEFSNKLVELSQNK